MYAFEENLVDEGSLVDSAHQGRVQVDTILFLGRRGTKQGGAGQTIFSV